MGIFVWAAFVSPLLAGFLVPAALAWSADRPARHRLRAFGIAAGIPLLLLLLLSLPESLSRGLAAAGITLSVSLLSAGLYLLLESLRASPSAAQAAASLVAPALIASLFVVGPGIPDSGDGATISSRITWLLALNPYSVLAYAVFDTDLLTLRVFYSNHLAGYPYGVPRLIPGMLFLALPGLALAGAAFLIRRSRRT